MSVIFKEGCHQYKFHNIPNTMSHRAVPFKVLDSVVDSDIKKFFLPSTTFIYSPF